MNAAEMVGGPSTVYGCSACETTHQKKSSSRAHSTNNPRLIAMFLLRMPAMPHERQAGLRATLALLLSKHDHKRGQRSHHHSLFLRRVTADETHQQHISQRLDTQHPDRTAIPFHPHIRTCPDDRLQRLKVTSQRAARVPV